MPTAAPWVAFMAISYSPKSPSIAQKYGHSRIYFIGQIYRLGKLIYGFIRNPSTIYWVLWTAMTSSLFEKGHNNATWIPDTAMDRGQHYSHTIIYVLVWDSFPLAVLFARNVSNSTCLHFSLSTSTLPQLSLRIATCFALASPLLYCTKRFLSSQRHIFRPSDPENILLKGDQKLKTSTRHVTAKNVWFRICSDIITKPFWGTKKWLFRKERPWKNRNPMVSEYPLTPETQTCRKIPEGRLHTINSRDGSIRWNW